MRQSDLFDVYKILNAVRTEYTLFSSAYVTLSSIEHILGHKTKITS